MTWTIRERTKCYCCVIVIFCPFPRQLVSVGGGSEARRGAAPGTLGRNHAEPAGVPGQGRRFCRPSEWHSKQIMHCLQSYVTCTATFAWPYWTGGHAGQGLRDRDQLTLCADLTHWKIRCWPDPTDYGHVICSNGATEVTCCIWLYVEVTHLALTWPTCALT